MSENNGRVRTLAGEVSALKFSGGLWVTHTYLYTRGEARPSTFLKWGPLYSGSTDRVSA